jgi:hypothetical protein
VKSSEDGVPKETEEAVKKVMEELKKKAVELILTYEMTVTTMAFGMVTMRLLAATTIAARMPVEESYEKFVDGGLRGAYDDAVEEIQEVLVDATMASLKI